MPTPVTAAAEWVTATVLELAAHPPSAVRLRVSGSGTVGRWDWPQVGGPPSLAYRAESALLAALHGRTGRVRCRLDALGPDGRPSPDHPQRTRVLHMSHDDKPKNQKVEVTGALRAGALAATSVAALEAGSSPTTTDMARHAIDQQVSLEMMLGVMRHGLATLETEHETIRDLTKTIVQSRSLDVATLERAWGRVAEAEAETAKVRTQLERQRDEFHTMRSELLALQAGAPEQSHGQLVSGINTVISNARGAMHEAAGLYALRERREARAAAVADAATASTGGAVDLPPMLSNLLSGIFQGTIPTPLGAQLMLQGAPDDMRVTLVELASHIVMAATPNSDGGKPPEDGAQ